jgi:flagellar hook-length control protein FliK
MLREPSGAGLGVETAAALAATQANSESLSAPVQTVPSGLDPMLLHPGSAGAAADRAQSMTPDRATGQPNSMAGGSVSADATPAPVPPGDLRPNAIGAADIVAAGDRLAVAGPRGAARAIGADSPAAAAPGSSDPSAGYATVSAAAGVAANPLALTTAPAGGGAPASAASAAAQPALSELPETAGRHVLGSVQSGGGEMVLQLHPQELGELSIRVAVDGRDVSAWFASPHAAVQQALSLTLGQLHADLGNAGYSLVGAWVGGDASGTGAGGGTSPAPQSERRKTETAAPQGASTTPLAAGSQGISIYV